jgi:DNA-binding transcriptional MerR regulator
MIKIGDFARLSQLSVATLRHYDEIGLLKPVTVDRLTGYRYYSTAQLPRLNRILALKDLGFSLDQIEYALAESVSADQLRGMLKLKRAEIAQRLADEQERLARIEARLRHIEQEDDMPNYDIVLKTVAPMRVAARRITIPTNDQVPDYLGPAFMEVAEYVQGQGAKASGAYLALWHTPTEVYSNEDAEAIVPIDRQLPTSERVQVYELPQAQMASVVHHGNFADFTQGHAALLTWIEANGYRVVGPFREIYIHHNREDLSDSTTEIQFPVEKA